MKKEVFSLIRNSGAKSTQGVMGIVLTMLVISILILSGPAQAVTVNLSDLSTASPDENTDVNFIASVDIDPGERVPVQYLTLTIGSDECNFNVDGSEVDGDLCSEVVITPTNSYSGYGLSLDMYGYDNNYGGNYSFGAGYGYGYDSLIPHELEYNITWTTSSVSENTAYTVILDALAVGDVTHTYSYTATNFITVQDVPLSISSVEVTEPDNFYSNVTGNDVVHLVVDASSALTVMANFSGVSADIDCEGGSSGPTITLTNNGTAWVGSCDVGDVAAVHNFDAAGPVIVLASDGGVPEVDASLGIALYNMTTFTDTECVHFGADSTDFSQVTDFSAINFVVDMEFNVSCMVGEESLPENAPAWMSDFERVLLLNFSSVDMSSEEAAAKIGNFNSYLDLSLTLPGNFGDSRISINSSYLAELDTAAEIVIYHLPFSSSPDIIDDPDAAGHGAFNWVQNTGEGNLFFHVDGFSGYDITDNIDPVIEIMTPADASTQVSPVLINVSINTTGTGLSTAVINISGATDGEYWYIYGDTNDANCSAVSAGSELYTCTISVDMNTGENLIVVAAVDFGGDEGNSAEAVLSTINVYGGPVTSITSVVTIDNSSAAYANNTWTRGNVTINSSCANADGPGCDVTLYCFGASCTPDALMGASVTKNTEGTFYFRYRSNDTNGIWETPIKELVVKIDQTLPVVSISSPASGSSSTINVDVAYSVTEDNINNCWWNEGGSNNVISCTAGSFSHVWSTGSHTVTVYANDTSGNVGSSSVTFSKYTSGGGGGGSSSPWSLTMTVTDSQLLAGFSRAMAKNERFQFSLGGTSHYVAVLKIEGNMVTFEIASTPFEVSLGIGEVGKYDLDNDGYYDLYVKLNGITNSKADTTIMSIHQQITAPPITANVAESTPEENIVPSEQVTPPVCSPDWRCGEWSQCVADQRARVCVDSNSCNTIEGKPAESESCRVPISVPWVPIVIAVLIIAVLAFVTIFYLQKRYDKD